MATKVGLNGYFLNDFLMNSIQRRGDMQVANAVEKAVKNIEKSIKDSPLSEGRVILLAAAKGQSVPSIEEAIKAGVRDFGENRVQEAEDKWPALRRAYPHLKLHLIGPLQSNKVKQALELFDVIQTLDRPKLALAIAKELEMRRYGNVEKESTASSHRHIATSPHPQFYIQVNTGKEPQKAGVMPEEADGFIDYCTAQLHLPVAGLMCVPPAAQPAAPHFAYLRSLAVRHGLKELSMGMSDDYEAAVRMGSTCVRLGRALFGERVSGIGNQESD